MDVERNKAPLNHSCIEGAQPFVLIAREHTQKVPTGAVCTAGVWRRGLFACAVEEAGRALAPFVAKVRVVDAPVPLTQIAEKIPPAPVPATIAPILPVAFEVASRDLAHAAGRRAVGARNAARLVAASRGGARGTVPQADGLVDAVCRHGHAAPLPADEVRRARDGDGDVSHSARG